MFEIIAAQAADVAVSELPEPVRECDGDACVVTYPPAFFARYKPVTALDIVRNVPGFRIDNGSSARGFAGSAGNVLINGERPAAKSESVSDILARFPSASVQKIILYRGQTGGLDVPGQSIVVDVVLNDVGGLLTYRTGVRYQAQQESTYPYLIGSYTGQAGPLDYTAGIEARRTTFRAEAFELVTDEAFVPFERRSEVFAEDGQRIEATANGTLDLGATTFRFNLAANAFDESGGEVSDRRPLAGSDRLFVLQPDTDDGYDVEAGFDLERLFGEDAGLKAIGLYRREVRGEIAGLAVGADPDEALTTSQTNTDTVSTENIARLEADYTGYEGHIIEAAIEAARNTLTSDFALSVDEGSGLLPVIVPGANTEVQETRFDVQLSDSFALGPLALDAVLAAETSLIDQSGAFSAERRFTFFKPSLTATYASSPRIQWRGRVRRRIGQLNFFDFVSNTDLDDDELALGNPDLAPETSISADLSVERRFGDVGVIELRGFADWITDVQDVLPLGGILEVPGNIGDGTRYTLRLNATLPTAPVGLRGGRLDINTRVQTSEVTDPVTGLNRRLSGENNWGARVVFRQDLTEKRIAWGFNASFQGARQAFGLDELTRGDDQNRLNVFAETTRFGSARWRIGLDNVLNNGFDSTRTVFEGQRGFSPVDFREIRGRDFGQFFFLEVEGTF